MGIRRVAPTALAAAVVGAVAFVGTAAADHPGMGGTPFVANLTGAAEVPGPGHPTASGTASLRLNSGQEEICGTITAVGLTNPATGTPLTNVVSHIHTGTATQAGGILVHLTPMINNPDGACVSAPRELIKQIRKNPENYYVNVHGQPGFGAGAIRGQLQQGQG